MINSGEGFTANLRVEALSLIMPRLLWEEMLVWAMAEIL